MGRKERQLRPRATANGPEKMANKPPKGQGYSLSCGLDILKYIYNRLLAGRARWGEKVVTLPTRSHPASSSATLKYFL